jgi:hypothetical protein
LKKTSLILFLLIFYFLAQAQKATVKNNPEYDDKPIHFGYTLGLNVMDFTFGRNYKLPNDSLFADVGTPMLGFQVGMICDFRLGEYFNLRCLPSFNFGQRNLSYYVNKKTIIELKIESSMLDFPVQIKYKAKRINNYRPYFIVGLSLRYDLASKNSIDTSKNDYILLKPLDFYYEVGFGIDYYMQYFKFSTELKLCLGRFDVLNRKIEKSTNEPYVNALTKLTSNIFMLSFHFE